MGEDPSQPPERVFLPVQEGRGWELEDTTRADFALSKENCSAAAAEEEEEDDWGVLKGSAGDYTQGLTIYGESSHTKGKLLFVCVIPGDGD